MATQFGSSSNPVFNSCAMPAQFNADKRRRFYMNFDSGSVREAPRQERTYAEQHGVPGNEQLQQQSSMPGAAGSQGAAMTYRRRHPHDDDQLRRAAGRRRGRRHAGHHDAGCRHGPGAGGGAGRPRPRTGLRHSAREPNPALILASCSATQGFFLGAFTWVLEGAYPGVAVQAVTATLVVFGTVLALFKSGKVRATPKLNKMFFTALIAYAVFSLLNLGLMLFTDIGMFGVRSGWLGVAIGAFAILLATYSLVLDFTNIQEGVDAGVEQKYGWAAAFGLTVSLVWLYVEILRVIVILRSLAE